LLHWREGKKKQKKRVFLSYSQSLTVRGGGAGEEESFLSPRGSYSAGRGYHQTGKKEKERGKGVLPLSLSCPEEGEGREGKKRKGGIPIYPFPHFYPMSEYPRFIALGKRREGRGGGEKASSTLLLLIYYKKGLPSSLSPFLLFIIIGCFAGRGKEKRQNPHACAGGRNRKEGGKGNVINIPYQ